MSCGDVSRDPFNEVGRVLGLIRWPLLAIKYYLFMMTNLDSLDLFLNLLHRNFSTVVARNGEVSLPALISFVQCVNVITHSVSRVGGCHHILRVKHLLRKLWDRDRAVARRSSRRKRRESNHEEMQSREGNHVDSELAEIRVELTGEAEAGGDTGHDDGDEVVKVTVRGRGELERPEADVVKGFVVDTERFVGVLDELVHGEGGIIRLDDGVGNLEQSPRHFQWGWRLPSATGQRRRCTSSGRGTPPGSWR